MMASISINNHSNWYKSKYLNFWFTFLGTKYNNSSSIFDFHLADEILLGIKSSQVQLIGYVF